MTFVQVIDCKTSRLDDMNQLMDTWLERTNGKRTATHSVIGRDRSDASHVVEIVEFPSYEEAMRNSELAETDELFQEIVALCEEPPSFTDLDVVREDQLNTANARRYFEEGVNNRSYDTLRELCTPDYREHDPANPADPVDLENSIAAAAEMLEALQPVITVESELAEGDLVTLRWTSTATHNREYLGVEPTGRELTVSGHTTFRFREDKIAESWWNWDYFGLLVQLGIIEQ
ncbi:hypothetical protein GCM10009716_31420 [Streptomyces sodiiphilus]|uniref:Ester cyclase n=1 Tax=Streptomyces sodiiphilus TaxID=226217 RepID=A0ABN2PFL3_9ACTN